VATNIDVERMAASFAITAPAKKSPGTETGAFRRSRAPRSSQGEEHERHDKGNRPSVPPAARKCGHDTRDEQRREGTQ
jgi:hypothetical protein